MAIQCNAKISHLRCCNGRCNWLILDRRIWAILSKGECWYHLLGETTGFRNNIVSFNKASVNQ